MKWANIMVVALALGGCTPDQDIARCEIEAIRLYPNDPPTWEKDVASQYITKCMKAKGYEYYSFPEMPLEDCGRVGRNYATDPGCYTSIGWLRRFLSRKS
jgi:hypothetical protein